ncbi:replication initiation and membrane attachment family protein [Ectobacillus polymachus]|uniref:replication initiation and membrane attachment family protein n=1 Tax=Ectobacillus polymachus TaxID=1508806 RepID=UPI003A87DDB5
MERQSWMDLLPVDRYRVYTSGLLHSYDRKILTMLYQPLIGSKAFSLYMTLWGELEQDFDPLQEQTHHSLMLNMHMSLPDIHKERMKLEGIGLLKVLMKKTSDERTFLYELQAPLTPKQFFDDIVLNIFLYNRLGITKYNWAKKYFFQSEMDQHEYSDITKSFNDIFQSFTPTQLTQYKSEIEQIDMEPAIGRASSGSPQVFNDFFDFPLFLEGISNTMIPRRAITEEVQETILKLAYVYQLDHVTMKKVVMDALIIGQDKIDIELLRKCARDWYQYEHSNELPVLSDRVQPVALQEMRDKVPQTKQDQLIKVLEEVSPKELLTELSGGALPAASDLRIIEDIMINQNLSPGVINVLIYYVMLRMDMKIQKSYVEKIAAHWARKHISTVRDAMSLAIQEQRQYREWAQGAKEQKKKTRSAQKVVRKELVPDWLAEEKQNIEKQDSEEQKEIDTEALRKKIEERRKRMQKRLNG